MNNLLAVTALVLTLGGCVTMDDYRPQALAYGRMLEAKVARGEMSQAEAEYRMTRYMQQIANEVDARNANMINAAGAGLSESRSNAIDCFTTGPFTSCEPRR